MDGFDKHILQSDKAQIEAEVCRLVPLVEEGDYIGFCDHRVPPDVPLENYLFFLGEGVGCVDAWDGFAADGEFTRVKDLITIAAIAYVETICGKATAG